MNHQPRSIGYLIALAAVLAATALRWFLHPWFGNELALVTYYLAVLAVAWFATFGPSLLTLVLGLAGGYLFAGGNVDPIDMVDFARYLIVGLATIAAMRSALRLAERQRRMLDGTIRTALDGIVTIDARDRIVEWNPAAERAFGHTRLTVIGRDLADLIIPPRYRERHRAALKAYVENGETHILDRRVEFSALRADGSEFPIELAVTRMSGTSPPLFTAYVRDVSERDQVERVLRESEQRFRSMIEQVSDYAIFLIDGSGRPTSWNLGVKRVLGYDEEEFVGTDISTAIFTPEDVRSGIPQRELAIAAERGTANNDRWMRRKDGTRFYAMGVTVSRRDDAGRLVGFAKIMRDQTQRKQIEDALSDTARHLGTVTERQSRFLAMLSHELRNPLAPIRNAAEILRMPQTSDAVRQEATEVIYRQVGQLVRLVDDLLDVNRIRSGKVQLRKERIDIASAVAHAIESAKAQCVSNPITVDYPGDAAYVLGDPTRITQIVSNLLHNGCKFTPNAGRIHVSVARENDSAIVRVVDEGIGIPPENIERIFDMFEQLDPTPESAQGGMGIGLSVSRSLAEMHGGSLVARSEGPGKGSEFILRLPLASETVAAPDDRRQSTNRKTPKRRVLVVDDNRDAVESLATVVRLNGHEVHCAHDGEEALEQEQEHHPEIVLLDIGLPKLDGYEVARRIRKRRKPDEVQLIAVTGWGQDEDVKRAKEAGFDAHVTKPIEYPVLLDILDRRAQP